MLNHRETLEVIISMPNPSAPDTAHLGAISDDELAYHEAGHAVIHVLQGGAISRVSIDRRDQARGVQVASEAAPAAATTFTAAGTAGPPEAVQTTQRSSAGTPEPTTGSDAARQRLAVLVAGDIAGSIHGGPRTLPPSTSDQDAALALARSLATDEAEATHLIDAARQQARATLQDFTTWQNVETVAQALLRARTLDGAQVQALINAGGQLVTE